MSTITESIDVAVPITTAYNQWTQFEEFPEFMQGVEKVVQINPTRTRWTIAIAGLRREFEAETLTQEPDRAISWESVDGPRHAGAIAFQEIDANTTRVTLRSEFDPSGLAEKAADATGILEKKAKGDMVRFKEFIESRGTSDGAWRGSIANNQEH